VALRRSNTLNFRQSFIQEQLQKLRHTFSLPTSSHSQSFTNERNSSVDPTLVTENNDWARNTY